METFLAWTTYFTDIRPNELRNTMKNSFVIANVSAQIRTRSLPNKSVTTNTNLLGAEMVRYFITDCHQRHGRLKVT